MKFMPTRSFFGLTAKWWLVIGIVVVTNVATGFTAYRLEQRATNQSYRTPSFLNYAQQIARCAPFYGTDCTSTTFKQFQAGDPIGL